MYYTVSIGNEANDSGLSLAQYLHTCTPAQHGTARFSRFTRSAKCGLFLLCFVPATTIRSIRSTDDQRKTGPYTQITSKSMSIRQSAVN